MWTEAQPPEKEYTLYTKDSARPIEDGKLFM